MLKFKSLIVASFVFSCVIATQASASLTFSNLNVTANSFTVDVSGTVPSGNAGDQTLLSIESNPLSTNPGWVIATGFSGAATYSFTGTHTMTQFSTGSPGFGDYVYLRLTPALSTGATLEGTITGTWTNDEFDPSAVTSIDVYWGNVSLADPHVLVASGIENTTPVDPEDPAIPVPTLSTYGLILIALALLLVTSRRLRVSTKHK